MTATKRSVEDLANDLASLASGLNNEEIQQFAKIVCHKLHRTHQQSIMRVLVSIIMEHAAKDPYDFDGRNEATVGLCKEIFSKVGPSSLKCLPFI
jgi:hypothetical protein